MNIVLNIPNKLCTKCNLKKPLNHFAKSNIGKDGFRANCKKCDSFWAKKTYNNRKTTISGYLRQLLWGIKARAKRSNIEFTITFDDVIELYAKQQSKCAITKVTLTHAHGNGRIKTNISIDRIDNTKGYTKDNIQLVCDIVNIMKNTMGLEELVHWCKLITG